MCNLASLVFLGTFCGVFRRQALDRGAALLRVDHIVTGHNADDIAETVLMNCEQWGWMVVRRTMFDSLFQSCEETLLA